MNVYFMKPARSHYCSLMAWVWALTHTGEQLLTQVTGHQWEQAVYNLALTSHTKLENFWNITNIEIKPQLLHFIKYTLTWKPRVKSATAPLT